MPALQASVTLADMARRLLALALLLAACKQSAESRPPPEVEPIFFGAGSNILTFDDRPVVHDAAQALLDNRALHVLLIGRTDARGRFDMNMQLGLQRAREVREAILLRGEGKIDPSRVHVGSRGPAEPTGDNSTEEGRAANRRVEFYFFYPDGTPLTPRFNPPIVIEGEAEAEAASAPASP
jgi:outer membrane protein OmpA-like peptidoglycan-associated protein